MRVAVVGSPPYAESLRTEGNGIDRSKMTYSDGRVLTATSSGPLPHTAYGTTEGQLGALPPGALDAPPQPTTPAPVTTWQGCYADGWQDLIVPDAFAHPAKFARGLIHRIYRHLLAQGYVRVGDCVLDPFGGVALGALDAMTYGLRYIGVELEPRFVALAQQNLELWRQRYGFTGGTVVQGDSRRLRAVLAGAQVGCVVGSPPWESSLATGQCSGIDPAKMEAARRDGTMRGHYASVEATARDWAKKQEQVYGTTPGQLGAMPPGAVVSSPPYEHSHVTNIDTGRIGDTPQQPVWKQTSGDYYGISPAQLGNTAGDTFWTASAQIVTELAALLPPGAVCAWVLKPYVKDKKIVPFDKQWQALCEARGFRTVEIIHASLIEHHGVQETFFGEAEAIQVKRASFFRRLAEKKGSPAIDYEVVLVTMKGEVHE